MNLRLRRLVAPLLRLTAPAFTSCLHCGWPWKYADTRTVTYSETFNPDVFDGQVPVWSKGVVISCEKCWPLLRPTDKIRYASMVVNGTGSGWRANQAWSPNDARDVMRAVAHSVGAKTDDDMIRLLAAAFPVGDS